MVAEVLHIEGCGIKAAPTIGGVRRWVGASLYIVPSYVPIPILPCTSPIGSLPSIQVHRIGITIDNNGGAAIAIEDDISFKSLSIAIRAGDVEGKAGDAALYAPGALIDIEIVHFDQKRRGKAALVAHLGLLGALTGIGAIKYIISSLDEVGNDPVAGGVIAGGHTGGFVVAC